jgi:hypothetical protein
MARHGPPPEAAVADLEFVRELAAADHHLAMIAVARDDGTVHGSLVKAGILRDPCTGSPAVGMVIAGRARKLELLRGRRHATVVFRDGWRWAAVEGAVRLVGPDDHCRPHGASEAPPIPEVLRAVYLAAGGTHDDWDEFDRAMAEDRRCAVFVATDAIRSN